MKIDSRIIMLDALRGYALMGLFLIHMVEYFELYWYQYVPHPINTVMFAIFGGKAYAIFSMLFGLSFYIIMQRQAERGINFSLRFIWRLALLFALGYLHGLIYGGDILQVLAVCGLILVPLWKANTKIVLAIAVLLLAQTPALGFIVYLTTHSEISYQQPFFTLLQKPVFEAYAHGSFWQVIAANSWGGQAGKWIFAWESGRLANIVGLSLVGFLLGRIGFFTQREKYQRHYVIALVTCIVLALAFHFASSLVATIPHPARVEGLLNGMVTNYFNLTLTFVSVLIFILLYQQTALQKALNYLAPAGRMSLTVYVGQSLLFVPFFYGFGANAYTYIGQVYSLLLGLMAWSLTLLLAHFWFQYFRMGPLEWCWRVATYRRTDIAFKNTTQPT